MTTQDLFQETYGAVTVNKVRSGLTMLGIVIGIASVIALVSIGQGTQNSIQASIQSLGSNLIMIMPGTQKTFGSTLSAGLGSSETLTPQDADALASIPGVAGVAQEVSGRYQVVYKGANTNVSVMGITSDYAQVRNVGVSDGTFITDANVSNASRIAVIGPTVLQTLFAPSENASATPDMAMGARIRIKGTDFTIVGITASKGGSGFNNQDNMIYVPLTAAQHFLLGSESYLSEIDIEAANQEDMASVQNSVTQLLLSRHNISDPAKADFNILNLADIISAASSVTGMFTALLAAIAAISLLVGGIGIMNMMLTTVTERTREIGLRKALGAKKKDITLQFLAESVMLTFSGGIAGILFGWLIAFVISSLIGISTSISLTYVLVAFGVSAGIGIVFGYYPARRAASLSPIEALRYE